MVVVCGYNPTQSDFVLFIKIMERMLNLLSESSSSDLLIWGDFNLTFIRDEANSNIFIDLLICYGLKQTVFDVIHKQSCLKNIFVNFLIL